jgi:hypothetical protein
MSAKQLYHFCLSYKINGEIFLERIDGINLRHAKEKLTFKHPEATDLTDWTNEREADIRHYIKKNSIAFSSHFTD